MRDSISNYTSILTKHKNGFTLVEMLVVIAFVGIILSAFSFGISGLFTEFGSLQGDVNSVSSKMMLLSYLDKEMYNSDSVRLENGTLIFEQCGIEKYLKLNDNIVIDSGAIIYLDGNDVHVNIGGDDYCVKSSPKN